MVVDPPVDTGVCTTPVASSVAVAVPTVSPPAPLLVVKVKVVVRSEVARVAMAVAVAVSWAVLVSGVAATTMPSAAVDWAIA